MSERTPEPGSQAWFEQLIDKETSEVWKKLGESFDEEMTKHQEDQLYTSRAESPLYEKLMNFMRALDGPEFTVHCHPDQYSFVADAINSEFNLERTRIKVVRNEYVKTGQVIVINHRKLDEYMRAPITRLPSYFLREMPDE